MDIIVFILVIAVAVIAGATHNIIFFHHVLPYMKNRGVDPQGLFAAFKINKTLSEYYKIEDPKEKKMKIILRLLNITFLIFMLILVGTILLTLSYMVWFPA